MLTFTFSVPAGTSSCAIDALVDRLDLHGRLVGLDLGDDIAGLDAAPFGDQPLGELALFHGRRQGGHQDLGGHRGLGLVRMWARAEGSEDQISRQISGQASTTWGNGAARTSSIATKAVL